MEVRFKKTGIISENVDQYGSHCIPGNLRDIHFLIRGIRLTAFFPE